MPPEVVDKSFAVFTPSSSLSRLNPGAALVFRFTPGLDDVPADGPAACLPVFFGGGRNELNPEKSPPPPPVVRARFAGGSSELEEVVA